MSLNKKLIGLAPAAAGTRTSDLGSDPFSDGNCICWIDFESSIEDETGTQTLTANGSITLTTDQVMFETTSGYFDATGVTNISGKDSITFPAGDGGRSDLDGWTNSNDLSLSVWIYWEGLNQPSSEQGAATILAITNGTGIQCRLRWNNISDPNKPNLNSYADSMIGDTALNVDAWNHLVFISPATDSSTESAEIYLNGTRVGNAVNWTRSSRSYYDSIGGEFNTVNNNSQYFNGYMDNLRIFKDRLTPSEVESLYNEGLSVEYMDYLAVAGGGSGGVDDRGAGGGGAGGLKTSYGSTSGGPTQRQEPRIPLVTGTYTITVGGGGAGVTGHPTTPNNGSDTTITHSSVGTIYSEGGGAGGYGNSASGSNYGGYDGGSGGGAAHGATSDSHKSSGNGNQGYGGGKGLDVVADYIGAGGGGASAVGADGTASGGGNGGNGLAVSITGSSVTYAGGGGGGAQGAPAGSGGTGGGGAGSVSRNDATNGTANTGGGGGGRGSLGAAPYSGYSGSGGSGIVILRMATSVYSGTTTGSPTVTTSGSDTILKFTGSGTYVH